MTTCKYCELIGALGVPAVRTILSLTGHDARETPLCRHHLEQWHRWRRLLYGAVEPRLGHPEHTASGTDA